MYIQTCFRLSVVHQLLNLSFFLSYSAHEFMFPCEKRNRRIFIAFLINKELTKFVWTGAFHLPYRRKI